MALHARREWQFDGMIVRAFIGDDGQARFDAADVCRVMGHSNPREALSLLDDDEKECLVAPTPGGPRKMTFVTMSGLFALILSSRGPEARRFRRWVTSGVLPEWVTSGVLPGRRKAGRHLHVPERPDPIPSGTWAPDGMGRARSTRARRPAPSDAGSVKYRYDAMLATSSRRGGASLDDLMAWCQKRAIVPPAADSVGGDDPAPPAFRGRSDRAALARNLPADDAPPRGDTKPARPGDEDLAPPTIFDELLSRMTRKHSPPMQGPANPDEDLAPPTIFDELLSRMTGKHSPPMQGPAKPEPDRPHPELSAYHESDVERVRERKGPRLELPGDDKPDVPRRRRPRTDQAVSANDLPHIGKEGDEPAGRPPRGKGKAAKAVPPSEEPPSPRKAPTNGKEKPRSMVKHDKDKRKGG